MNSFTLGLSQWKLNPVLSDFITPGTSKLDWRCFEHNKIDRNELKIHKNSQKGTETKMAEKLKFFENFDSIKIKIYPCA